jgi:hypothetical protein
MRSRTAAVCLAGILAGCAAEGDDAGGALGTPMDPSGSEAEAVPPAGGELDAGVPADPDADVPAAPDAGAPGSGADAGSAPWTPGESCAERWRSWRPTWAGAPRTLIQPAAGVLDGRIVVHGGRQHVTTLSAVSGTTYAFTPPTCADAPPDWTRITTTGAPPQVWGAASTVAAGQLWVIGGTSSGAGMCKRETRVFRFTGPDTGEWTTIAALLPEGLCHASAATIVDGEGKEWIVVTGGSLRSVPNTSCAGGAAPTARALRLDPGAAAPAWEEVPTADGVITGWGAATAASVDGTRAMLWSGSTSTGLPGAPVAAGLRIALTADVLGVDEMAPAAPERFLAAAGAARRDADGQPLQIVVGGATTLGPGAGCTGSTSGTIGGSAEVWTYDEDSGALLASETAPRPRAGHVVVVAPSGGRDKVYVIGGQDGQYPVWDVDELRP